MIIFYENSKGDRIDFYSDKVSIQDPESLFASQWEYSAVNSINFGAKIKKFNKTVQQRNATLSIFCDSESEYNSLNRQMSDIFDYDIANNAQGHLWVNDSYLECNIISNNYVGYEPLFNSVDRDIVILTGRPKWITPRIYSTSDAYVMQTSVFSAPVKLEFVGKNRPEYIYIGDNTYEITYSTPTGSTLVIDGLNKVAYVEDADGERINVFAYRNKDYDLFAEIPYIGNAGQSITPKSGAECFITLYELRSEPNWI